MADYARANSGGTTHFGDKDALTSGDADKVIVGSQFDTEFNAIVTAVASKLDTSDLSTQIQAEALTLDTVLITPHTLNDVLVANAGMAKDIQQLADPGADRILFWDDSAGAAALLTVGTGLTLSGTTLASNDAAIVHDNLSGFVSDEHVAHSGVDFTAGAGLTGGGTIAASRSFAVGAGDGITVNADDVALAASVAGLGLSYTAGVLAVDTSELSELAISAMSQSLDGFVIDDDGVPKVMPYDEAGIKVQTVAGTSDTLAATDMNTFIEYTAATAVTVTLNTGVGAIGNVVIIQQAGAGQVTVGGTATLDASVGTKTRTEDSVIILVNKGSDTWALYGDAAA